MQLKFYKYHGTGNDFVLLDNRGGEYSFLTSEDIRTICHRRFGIGADGLMLLNEKEGYDFEMSYFNADGNIGTMCGNGGRCIVMFAKDLGIKRQSYHFLAADGEHSAAIDDQKLVALKMKDVSHISKYKNDFVLDTGSPHYVQLDADVMKLDVVKEGRKIRYGKDFAEKGINVNFVQIDDADTLIVRTYERGVEDETYSCGTGVTAAGLVFYHHENGFNSIDVKTLGGLITVRYVRHPDGSYENIWIKGPAIKVFEGVYNV